MAITLVILGRNIDSLRSGLPLSWSVLNLSGDFDFVNDLFKNVFEELSLTNGYFLNLVLPVNFVDIEVRTFLILLALETFAKAIFFSSFLTY